MARQEWLTTNNDGSKMTLQEWLTANNDPEGVSVVLHSIGEVDLIPDSAKIGVFVKQPDGTLLSSWSWIIRLEKDQKTIMSGPKREVFINILNWNEHVSDYWHKQNQQKKG